MAALSINAHAKINLYLKVLGRRPDGYHELESVLQTLTLYDTLVLDPSPEGIALRVEGAPIPADRDNLVWKAATRLLEESERRAGARILLHKRIPVGAGLGGGSSDAAVTMVALNRLLDLRLPERRLVEIAGDLGSDVPYFLVGGTALVRGRGDEVRALPDLPSCDLQVVQPRSEVSTAAVYAQVDAPLTPPGKTDTIPRLTSRPVGGVEGWVRMGNDLEPHARSICPAIGEIRDRLASVGASAVGMTGSGSAMFGAFPNGVLRDRAAREMERVGWSALSCSPLSRLDYQRTLGLN